MSYDDDGLDRMTRHLRDHLDQCRSQITGVATGDIHPSDLPQGLVEKLCKYVSCLQAADVADSLCAILERELADELEPKGDEA